MKNNLTFLKIAPAFFLASAMLSAQKTDSTKTKEIEQVVLIGYGKQKKTDLTGSITSITSKDFNNGAISSPEQLVQGKAAGVQITTNGGAPGSGSVIRIRGGASLNASNDPLIVIDGVPVDNNGINGAANPLAMINPNDIESFNILKDASATAIYGSRASNGVIIITTKKGTSGKLKVSYTATTSVYTPEGNIPVMSAEQYRAVANQYGSPAMIAAMGTSNTNWQNEIYRTAVGMDNNVAISGGLKWLPYRLSLGYLDQDGLLITNTYKRSTVGVNLSPKFFDKHLSVDINFKGIYNENRFADAGAVGAAMTFDPTQSVYNPNNTKLGGYWEWLQANGDPVTIAGKNPVSMLRQKTDLSYVTRYIGNAQLDYKFHFLPDLRANLNVGFDNSSSNGNTTVLPTYSGAYFVGGTTNRYEQTKKNKLLDFYLNYLKKIDAIKSTVDLTAGYSYQDWKQEIPGYYIDQGTGQQQQVVAFGTQNTLLSYFGRLNYTLMDRYLLTATVRRDASSRFSKDNRVGWFPSFALAWRIDQEAFLKGQTTLSTLKLRGGWGQTGQQDISSGDYPYLARYVAGDGGAQYQLGNQYYTTLRAQGYDPNIKWETTTTKNVGLDFGFLNERISGTIDLYQKDTKDLLSTIPVPAGANLTNLLLTNVGNMRNRGLEIGLNVKAVQKEHFTWEFSANATTYKSEITNLSKTNDPNQNVLVGGISGGTGNSIQVQAVGYQPYSFYVYQQVYDNNGKPLEGVYVDRNRDGQINSADLYKYKSPAPKWMLAFSSKFTHDNWDLGFSLRASIGNYVYNNMASNAGTLAQIAEYDSKNFASNFSTSYLNTGFKTYQYFSDLYVENASFLKMDNINLGYNLPHFINENSKLRIYAAVQNVFTVTKYSGLDPEVYGGIDNNLYQRPRIYSLGFNFQF